MNVVFTSAALTDLEDIRDFIGRDSRSRADSFIDELLERCAELSEMAEAFSVVPRFSRHGIRKRVHGNYLIFYRVRENQIEIVHLLNGARDYERMLTSDS